MTSDTVSRAEFDARLLVVDTKADAHFDKLMGTIENFRVEQKSALGNLDGRVSRLEEGSRESRMELKTDLKNTRYWIAGTAISMVAALAGINHSMLSNLSTIYALGQNVGGTNNEIKQSIDQLRRDLTGTSGTQRAALSESAMPPQSD